MRSEETETRQTDAERIVKAMFTESDGTTSYLHPVKATPGEKLPDGFSRSYAGFLLREDKRVIQVDQTIVKQEMDYLASFAVIESFVKGKPPQHEMQAWLEALQTKVRGKLPMGRSLGKASLLLRLIAKIQ